MLLNYKRYNFLERVSKWETDMKKQGTVNEIRGIVIWETQWLILYTQYEGSAVTSEFPSSAFKNYDNH